MPVERVSVTPAAEAVLRKLGTANGPLLFHQSGGCCDGSSPMCYPRREFHIGEGDVYLGEIAGVPFYIGARQFEYWQHTHLTVDVVPGRGSGFSLEAPEGVRFLTRSRLFTDDEWAALQREGAPPRGDQAARVNRAVHRAAHAQTSINDQCRSESSAPASSARPSPPHSRPRDTAS